METKSKSAAQKVCKGHLKKNTTMFTSEQKILIGMEAICGKFSRLSSVVSIAFIKLQFYKCNKQRQQAYKKLPGYVVDST